jgi:putative ABC transport system permease protein
MITHYIKLSHRSLLKNRYYTLLNVFGLVFGMLSALIISKYIGGSLAFDSFHVNKERIYSLGQQESINGVIQKQVNATYLGVGELLREFPDVTAMTRFSHNVESLVIADPANGRVSFNENKICTVDSSFLKIFTFPLIYGDAGTALSRVNSIILTRSSAQKYFGDANPVGRAITIRVPWGEETMYEITGVAEDVPQRSRFTFDFLVNSGPVNVNELWISPDFATYVLVDDQAIANKLPKQISSKLKAVAPLNDSNRSVELSMKRLTDISLTGTEYLLAAVGIFITLISWVNYINQVIAQSYWRFKEVGMLRVMGATKKNLTIQFVVESGIVCSISLLFVISLFIILKPFLQSVTQGHLLPLFDDGSLINLIFLAIFVIGIAIAATVPTLILFSNGFATTLRNAFNSKVGGIGLRKALVVGQFSVSTVLVISIFIIHGQLKFMQSLDKGFSMDHMLVLKAPIAKDTTWNVKRKTLEVFMERCRELPFVIDITSSTTVPGEAYRHEAYLSVQGSDSKTIVHQNQVNDNFFSLYDVQFAEGHNFIEGARAENRTSIILNESAARALGVSNFRDRELRIVDHEEPDAAYNLIGIVKDFHQTSTKYEIKPMAFKFNVQRGHFSLKIHSAKSGDGDFGDEITALKKIWDETYPEASFEYFRLRDRFAAQDREDIYFGKLFQAFTCLSIVISCLGLFGLSLMISTKREREIGIRKVFGASAISIVGMFLKGYLQPLVVSMAIGAPVAYFLMDMWLRNYAYRIEIGFMLMTIAMLTLTVIFLLTVSYHILKSSASNPITILKD